MTEHLKVAGDVVAGGIVVAHIFKWAPIILAIPAAIYACLRIIEWFVKKRWRR